MGKEKARGKKQVSAAKPSGTRRTGGFVDGPPKPSPLEAKSGGCCGGSAGACCGDASLGNVGTGCCGGGTEGGDCCGSGSLGGCCGST